MKTLTLTTLRRKTLPNVEQISLHFLHVSMKWRTVMKINRRTKYYSVSEKAHKAVQLNNNNNNNNNDCDVDK